MSAREINDAAVEAAARNQFERLNKGESWDGCPSMLKTILCERVREDLSAALPFLGGIEEVRADEVRGGDEVWIDGAGFQFSTPDSFWGHSTKTVLVRRSSSTGEEPVGPFSGVTDEALLEMGRSSLGHGAPNGEEEA